MTAVGPRRSLRDTLFVLAWLAPIAVVFLCAGVLIAVLVRGTPAVTAFIETYPGTYALPEWAPVGFPAWLAWQHFFSSFLLLLIIRTGWQLRFQGRPTVFWRRTALADRFPSTRISFTTWLHLVLDVLWIVNGVAYVVLLFASGQWIRIVPSSWEVFPNAASAFIQYASLNWPVENGWVNYNGLQQLSYFVTVFVAAPLAIVTGFRMSPLWNQRWRRFDAVFPLRVAKSVHWPVMLYFIAFTIAHVTLVLATGAVRNLNHMYAVRDDTSWVGLAVFAGSVVVMVVGWVLARPLFLKPVASIGGEVVERRR